MLPGKGQQLRLAGHLGHPSAHLHCGIHLSHRCSVFQLLPDQRQQILISFIGMGDRPGIQFYLGLGIMVVATVLMVKDTISLQHTHEHAHVHTHEHSHGQLVHIHEHTHIHSHTHVHGQEESVHSHTHAVIEEHDHLHSALQRND